MSRYSLRPLHYLPELFEVAIGWDPGLATYFAAVYGPPDHTGDPEILRAIGMKWREAPNPETAIAFVRPVAQIPYDIFRRLSVDARKNPASTDPPSVAQMALMKTSHIGKGAPPCRSAPSR